MKWSNFTAVAENVNGSVHGKQLRAVSVKHAMTKCEREYPSDKGYHRHEVEKCRCSEINNDQCSACYLLTSLR